MEVSVAVSDDVRGHHRWLSLLVRHPLHARHLALRLLDEQVDPTATNELCGRPHARL